jgi:SpoU rRNA methylase family enzyme
MVNRKMNPMKLIWLIPMIAAGLTGLTASAAPAPGPWEKPAAALAGQIYEILGPGQARLTIRNLSTISNDEIPAIRRLLEQDLKTLGVLASGAESANEIRLTLSENQRGRVWVAEIVEGNETRVAMVEVKQGAVQQTQAKSGVTLRKQSVLTTRDEVLAALEIADAMVVLEPEEIVVYGNAAEGWQERKRVGIGQKKPLPRDPRGMILATPGGDGFEASAAGMSCSGSYQPAQPAGEWSIQCRESDDPWSIFRAPVGQAGGNAQEDVSVTPIKAFYNAARDYFTGILSPSLGPELPSFYTAAWLARPSNGAALLLGGVDGKLEILENGALKPVAGARDCGSDFAALQPGCGANAQIVASGSGEAASDSLRAFELPAQEAVPSSAPLAMDGTVTALWTAPDGKSVLAVVRKTANPGATDRYEVDRVTASCN